jgi:predicted secreted acid phosphatase
MRTGASLAVLALLLTPALGTAARGAPPKYPAEPEEIREYRDSGDWDRDISAVAKRAKAWLRKRVLSKDAPRKPALVLDIDETSLDNYPCIEAGDFQDMESLVPACVVRYDAPAIEQTRSIFRRARKLEVAVFFVTGRRDAIRKGTRENLRQAGYTGRYRLVTRPTDDDRDSAAPYKRSARREIEGRGFTIVANVGDQRSDLKGGYSERRFYLPNPMYFTE